MPMFATRDKLQLHYEVTGHGGPALVFVHGWCSRLQHWDAQVPYFAERHRVLRVDRRGHGGSGVPQADVSPALHAHDLAQLMRALEIEAAVVVGHAGGGPSVLELAGRHPELVRAAVFVDAGLYRGVSAEKAAASPLVVRLLEPDYRAEFVARYENYFHRLSGPALARAAAADAAQTPQHVMAHELSWIFRSNTIELASKLPQPVLWVVSSESAATSSRVREHLPQARFAQVVGAGHFLHMEVPEQFNPMLRRFLSDLE